MTLLTPPENGNLTGFLTGSLIIAGLIAAVAGMVLTQGTEERWVGHSVTGFFGLILLLLTAVSGAAMKRRITFPRPVHAFRLHRIASLMFVAFTVGTFFLGMYAKMHEEGPLLATLHGKIGLLIAVLALVQLIPHHILRGRPSLNAFHKFAGYLIIPLFLLQILLGIGMSDMFES